jgi:hypothetical protein
VKPIDKNYLLLQFKNLIYSKNGIEFQSFFENIMGKVHPNFRKIPSGGGDGGNDGWIKEDGKYYQVYAPNVPAIKDSDAAKKVIADFENLLINWNDVAEIKEYYFVYNDKYVGAKKPEISISQLQAKYSNIKFELLLVNSLEAIFFNLEMPDMLSLGFDIDQRDSIKNANKVIDIVRSEINKENVEIAYDILLSAKNLIDHISNESLSLEYELLECNCLRRLERTPEALIKYEFLYKNFRKNNKFLLAFAEFYLTEKDFEKNKLFLDDAEKIDGTCPLFILEKTVRRICDGDVVSANDINFKIFDSKERSRLMRVLAFTSCIKEDYDAAEKQIEAAIKECPEIFLNHLVKLMITENAIISNVRHHIDSSKIEYLVSEINKFEESICDGIKVGFRNKAKISLVKLNVYKIKNENSLINNNADNFLNSIMRCHYNAEIDSMLSNFLHNIQIPESFLIKLLEYIKNYKNVISDKVLKLIIMQLMVVDKLLSYGKYFFDSIESKSFSDLIDFIKDNKIKEIVDFVGDDVDFSLLLISAFKKNKEIKLALLNGISTNDFIQKDKVLFHIYYEDADYDLAFSIIRQMDFSTISIEEAEPILRVIRKKEAWDLEVILLKKTIDQIFDGNRRYAAKLQLFTAYLNLQCYREVIDLGVELLDSRHETVDCREEIIHNTIVACIERGSIDKSLFEKAKEILQRYRPEIVSYGFSVKVEVAVYLKNDEPEKALEAMIGGIKRKKILSSSEYSQLFFDLAINIADKVGLNSESIAEISNNSFVKLEGKSKWYFIGNDNELDAIKITSEKPKYDIFLGKKKGDIVSFNDPYGTDSQERIEFIYSIDKYIFWCVQKNFYELSNDGDMEGVQVIKGSDDPGDFTNLIKYMDAQERQHNFFELYCERLFPLSILATAEGGLINAIGRIGRARKGFVNISDGSLDDIDRQKKVAKETVDGTIPFYLDGTSALFLSEMGLLEKILIYIPNMKVPQSVINMLVNVAAKFNADDQQKGFLFLDKGNLQLSLVEREKMNIIKENIASSIKAIELNLNISTISFGNKTELHTEVIIFPELCDACILASRENLPVLTDDFLHLKYSSSIVRSVVPSYFSSFILMRVLYEDGKISFDDYLDYFSYLSSYRCRFLNFDSNDIEKAVLGGSVIKNIDPKAIGKFNFRLTLSPDYGVSFKIATSVIGNFVSKMALDESITPYILDRILVEIMENIPEKIDKTDFSLELFRVIVSAVDAEHSNILVYRNQLVIDKINGIKRILRLYTRSKILTIYKNN